MGKAMGVGTVYLMIAQAITIVCSYLIQVGLGRFLGPEQYGVFGVLLSLYSINRAFLNTGVPTTVSKFISNTKENVKGIMDFSFRIQLTISLIFGLIYVGFSKHIALLLNDSSLVNYIILLGIMVVPLSIVPLYNGFFRGLRKFKHQALFRIAFPVSRVIFTFILVFLGIGIFGALFGYFFSSLFTILIGWFMLKKMKINATSEKVKIKEILTFSLPVIISSFALAQTRSINSLFLKSFLDDNFIIGIYTAAATLSNLPYMIFIALPQTLLPSISKATSEKNFDLARKYTLESFRYLVMLLFPLTIIIFLTSEKLVSLVYTDTYASAGIILSVLIIGSSLLILYTTFLSIITGSGRPWLCMGFNLFLIILLSSLNYFLIPLKGAMGAALSSLISSIIAVIVIIIYTFRKLKIIFPLFSFFKILISSFTLFFFIKIWSLSGIYLILSYIVYSLLYFLLLYLFGEINSQDFSHIKKVFKIFKRN